jgi:antitoxin component YwqK of YwqJK toxin-antitoxin module
MDYPICNLVHNKKEYRLFNYRSGEIRYIDILNEQDCKDIQLSSNLTTTQVKLMTSYHNGVFIIKNLYQQLVCADYMGYPAYIHTIAMIMAPRWKYYPRIHELIKLNCWEDILTYFSFMHLPACYHSYEIAKACINHKIRYQFGSYFVIPFNSVVSTPTVIWFHSTNKQADGGSIVWYANGQLRHKRINDSDNYVSFHYNGTVQMISKRHFDIVNVHKFDDHGNMEEVINLLDDQRHGVYKKYDQGIIVMKCTYFLGKLHGKTYFYEKGVIKSVINYHHGAMHGERIDYTNNKITITNYDQGSIVS